MTVENIKRCRIPLILILVFVFIFIFTGCETGGITISFDPDNGTTIRPITVDSSMTSIDMPDEPQKTGYNFLGWYIDAERTTLFDSSKIPTENITLYAGWTPEEITITFRAKLDHESSYEFRYRTVTYGSSLASVIPEVPFRAGYSGSWNLEGIPINNIQNPYTIDAIYEVQPFDMTFVLNNGDEPIVVSEYMDEPYQKPMAPTREDYVFGGWFSDEECTSPFIFPQLMPNYNITLYAWWVKETELDNYFLYEIADYDGGIDNAIRITGITRTAGYQTNILIPNEIEGLPVKFIGYDKPYEEVITEQSMDKHTIFDSQYLSAILISDMIELIGTMAFSSAPNLTTVSFMENPQLQKISDAAFHNCTKLESFNLPVNVRHIGDFAFASEEQNMNISHINVPDNSNLEHLGKEIFKNTTALNNFKIPRSITSLDFETFQNSSIKQFDIEDGHTTFSVNAGVIFTLDGEELVLFPSKGGSTKGADIYGNALYEYSIPNTTRIIGPNSFMNNHHLTHLIIPDRIQNIREYACYNMANLQNIEFGALSNLNTIEQYAFSGSIKLSSIAFPSALLNIGDYAFSTVDAANPMQLTEVIFSNGLTTIGQNAFSGCSILTDITIPPSVQFILDYAFYNCHYLTLAFENRTQSQLQRIGPYAFYNCYNIQSVTLPYNLLEIGDYSFSSDEEGSMYMQLRNVVIESYEGARNLATIGEGAFAGCIFLEQFNISDQVSSIGERAFYNCKELIAQFATNIVLQTIEPYTFYGCEKISNIIIPRNVTTIGSYAFYGCKNLTTIRSGIQAAYTQISTIGESAFEGCINLTNDTTNELQSIPFALTEFIGKRAFYGCSKLNNIKIVDTIEIIQEQAFAQCTSLNNITYGNSPSLTTLNRNVFQGCNALISFNLPNTISTFDGNPFTDCDSLVFFNVNSSNPYFETVESTQSNYNVLYSKTGERTILFFPTGISTTFEVPADVKSIAPYAFYSSKITLLTFQGSSTDVTIGEYAFAECKQLLEVRLSERVSEIGNHAFYNDTLLSNLTIIATDNTNTLSIGDYAFYNNAIATITIPERIDSIGQYAFSSCYNLNNITFTQTELSSEPLSINNYAFYECTSLASIELPSRINNLGNYVFSWCVGLQNVQFSESDIMLTLGSYVFDNCHLIKAITLPNRIYSMGSHLFNYCLGLEDVIIEELNGEVFNQEGLELGEYAFYGCNELRNVTIPAHITKLGDYAFYMCQNVNNLIFTDGEDNLIFGEYSFSQCQSLTHIAIPARTTYIGSYAFYESNLGSPILRMNNNGVTVAAYKNDLTFEESQKEMIIGQSSFEKTNISNVTLPSRIKQIGAYAFKDNHNLSILSFETDSKCTTISQGAFEGIGGAALINSDAEYGSLTGYNNYVYENVLYKIVLADNLLELGNYVFRNSTSLVSITINEGLDIIGEGAFYGCSGLTYIDIPSSVISIKDFAFFNCSSLQTVNIESNNDYTLGSYAFAGCSALTSLSLKMVSMIGDAPAYECQNLSSLNVDLSNPYYKTINDVLYTRNVTYGEKFYTEDEMLILYPAGKQGSSYAISRNTKEIGDRAFSGNKYLTSLSIDAEDSTVLKIHDNTFENTSLDLEFFVVAIFEFLYEQNPMWRHFADKINSLDLSVENFIIEVLPGDNQSCRIVKYIGMAEAGSNLTIPTTLRGLKVKEIGENAFSHNAILKIVTIPQGVTKIANHAFYNCISLEIINISDSVQDIGEYAFYNCKSLINVVFGQNSLLTNISDYAFQLCTSLQTITLPWRLSTIGMFAFAGNQNNYMQLQNINFNENNEGNSALEIIKSYAFQYNEALNNITLPRSVTLLETNLFNKCTALTSIKLLRGNNETITELQNDNVFVGTPTELMIYVPRAAMKDYLRARHWKILTSKISYLESLKSEYSLDIINHTYNGARVVEYLGIYDIQADVYNKSFEEDFIGLEMLNNLPKVTVNTSAKTFTQKIRGTAKSQEYKDITISEQETVVVYDHNKRPHTIIIEKINFTLEGIRLLKYSGYQIDLTIPSELEGLPVLEIGEYCFSHKINSVIIPEGVLSINRNAFRYCANITSITLPLTLTHIGNNAFYGTNLQIINIGNNENDIDYSRLSDIGEYAFYNCVWLTEFIVPAACNSIGNYAFSTDLSKGRMLLEKVEFAGVSMNKIGIYAFANTNLTSITLPDKLITIGEGAFKNCIYLISLYIYDDSATSSIINLQANSIEVFEGCPYVKIYVASNKLSLYRDSFGTWNTLASKIYCYDFIFDGFTINITDDINNLAELVHYIGEDSVVTIPTTINGYTITTILPYTFNNNIKIITIPSTIRSIRSHTFYKSGVEEVYFNSGSILETIGQEAFRYTPLNTITIPLSVTSISDYAFADTALTNISFDSHDILEIEEEPVSTLVINGFAFSNNDTLINITLPRRLISIGEYAFYKNTQLKNINMPEDGLLESIYSYAFAECNSLDKITIPFSVTEMYTAVFDYCVSLETIYIKRGNDGIITDVPSLTTIGPGLLNNIDNSFLKIYVPKNSVNNYKIMPNWRSYSGYSETGIHNPVSYPDYLLPYSVIGDFAYEIIDGSNIKLTHYRGSDTELIIPGQITIDQDTYNVRRIGRFFGNKEIKTVTILEGYRQVIELYAFSECTSLEKVTLADTVEAFHNADFNSYAFQNCVNLREINIPEAVEVIPVGIFSGCVSLKEIILPESITEIQEAAFINCSALMRLHVNAGGIVNGGNSMLLNTSPYLKIFVDYRYTSTYRTTTLWSQFASNIINNTSMYGYYATETLINNEIRIIQFYGNVSKLYIPEYIKGRKVSNIALNAITPSVTEIYLPQASNITFGNDIADRINYY